MNSPAVSGMHREGKWGVKVALPIFLKKGGGIVRDQACWHTSPDISIRAERKGK